MTYRGKQAFFLQLAQLLRAGIALPAAVEKLSRSTQPGARLLASRLRVLLASGCSTEEAFARLRPELGPLERTTLAALAGSGSLVTGLERLAEHFGALAQARAAILRQSAYPLFILHLGVLLLNAPLAVTAGATEYLQATGLIFLKLYGAAGLVALLLPPLLTFGAYSAAVDRWLRRVPLIGKARRALATARFCGTLDLQLEAGINVMNSVAGAGEASRSGLLHTLARRAQAHLRRGASLAEALEEPRGALPGQALDDLRVAAETGQMHHTLPALRAEYQAEGLRRMEIAAEWLPRLLYLGVVLVLGWKVLHMGMNYARSLDAPM